MFTRYRSTCRKTPSTFDAGPNGIVVAPEGGIRTVAHEWLFGSGTENRFDGSDGSGALTAVIAKGFPTIGREPLEAGFGSAPDDIKHGGRVVSAWSCSRTVTVLEGFNADTALPATDNS